MLKHDTTTSEFFVGYSPTPAGLRRVLLLSAFVVTAVALTAAIAISMNMRDPGDGKWALNDRVQVEGIFLAEPYAMLALPGDTARETEVLLVVNQGKTAGPAARELHGRRVRADGFLLSRLGQRMFELADTETPIQVIGDAAAAADSFQWMLPARAPQIFDGEIIDPKCFLGAMKPGEGKTHKACAALCLRGGIPPMFWRQTPDGGKDEIYLLAGPNLAPLIGSSLEPLIPYVADAVQIQAKPRKLGTLSVLELVPGSIQRR